MNNFVLIGNCVGYMPPIDVIKVKVGEDVFIADITTLREKGDCHKEFQRRVAKQSKIAVYGKIMLNQSNTIWLKVERIVDIKGDDE